MASGHGEIMNMDGGTDPAPDYGQGSPARDPCSRLKSRVPLEHPDLHPGRFWPRALQNPLCQVDQRAATSSIPKGLRAPQIPDPAPAPLPGSKERIGDKKKIPLPPGAAPGGSRGTALVWFCPVRTPVLTLLTSRATSALTSCSRDCPQGHLCCPAAGTVPRDAVPMTFIPVPKPAGTKSSSESQRQKSQDFGTAVTFQL